MHVNINQLLKIRADAGSQFTSKAFREAATEANFVLSLAAPHHQEQAGLQERHWETVCSLAYAMVNEARVGLEFIPVALEHAWKVKNILPAKGLVDKDGKPTTAYFKHYGKKPNVRHLRCLFCPCFVRAPQRSQRKGKQVQHFNRRNHPQRAVVGVYFGVPRGQSGHLVWIPQTNKLIVSKDVVFDENFNLLGPRQHRDFADAYPTRTAASIAEHLQWLRNQEPKDNHHGTPQHTYHEDTPSDGFLRATSTNDIKAELDESAFEQVSVEEEKNNKNIKILF